MSLLSSLFRSSPPARPRPPEQRALPWRKNDFTTWTVGHDQQAVMRRGRAPVVLPGFLVDFVNSCERFESLEKRIQDYGDKHAWGSLEVESLRSWLPKVVEAGILVSAETFLADCQQAAGPDTPAKLRSIGFPTGGDRVDLVERAMRSFVANAREHGREIDFTVADSSAQPQHRDAFRSRLRELATELALPVRYSGEEERRRLADALIQEGADADAVEFALFDPLQIGFACGANRNALLLEHAGEAFFSVDDDVICELTAAPNTAAKLKLFSQSDPFVRWLFPDRESALCHAPTTPADFIAAHEGLLGRSMSALTQTLSVGDLDLGRVNDDFVRRLETNGGQVRATFAGHLGDPGIPTSVYYLYYEGENRRRLTEDEETYRRILASRNVFALAPCATVGDSSTSPGMAMGLDHRELLPPFFPVLHAEDFIYGAVLWQTIGNAFLGHCPVAVRHEPRAGKGILQPSDLHAENRAVIFEFAHLIRRVILRAGRAEHADPVTSMKSLGKFLQTLADQPERDFLEYIRGHVLEHESTKISYLEEQLREDTETPDFWRDDLTAYLDHVRDSLTKPDFDIPFDIKADRSDSENRFLIQRLFDRYGRLLQAWPDIVQAMLVLKSKGFETSLLFGK